MVIYKHLEYGRDKENSLTFEFEEANYFESVCSISKIQVLIRRKFLIVTYAQERRSVVC